MNPHIYDEHRLKHRRFHEYYRKTLVMGAVSLLLGIWIGAAHMPMMGPGVFANTGFSAAGLLLLWSLRNVHQVSPQTRWGTWLKQKTEAPFPAVLIGLQGWFLSLIALLMWFTVTELGFPANGFHHTMLLGILFLIPIRRILNGTEPPHPTPWRELITEALGYLNVCLITLFVAAVASTASLPPDKPLTGELPMGIIFIWMAAVLVVLTCIILLLDHIVRKMPPTIRTEEQDTLD